MLNQTKHRYKNCQSLIGLNDSFDVFIVGSDQVWNPRNNAYDPAYLLQFVEEDKIRISYAASFGTQNIDGNYLKNNAELFKRFCYISVREMSGKDLLKRELGLDSEIMVDPVFLISKVIL